MKEWVGVYGALLAGVVVLCGGLIYSTKAFTVDVRQVDIAGVAAPEYLGKLAAYDTLEEAGVHAIERAYKCSHVYECGGPIAKRPDGKFVVGPVLSDEQSDHTTVSHAVPYPFELAADYHTHPCLPDTHEIAVFSPTDLIGSLSTKTVAFMGDLCTGEVHEFDPATDKPNDVMIPGADVYTSAGRVVGHITVDGANVEAKTGML